MLKDITKHRNALKRIKSIDRIPVPIWVTIITNGRSEPHIIQFFRDLQLYGLYEAILYLENYERDGYFLAGTTQKVAIEALKAMQ